MKQKVFHVCCPGGLHVLYNVTAVKSVGDFRYVSTAANPSRHFVRPAYLVRRVT
jgi:hypothetical protein